MLKNSIPKPNIHLTPEETCASILTCWSVAGNFLSLLCCVLQPDL